MIVRASPTVPFELAHGLNEDQLRRAGYVPFDTARSFFYRPKLQPGMKSPGSNPKKPNESTH